MKFSVPGEPVGKQRPRVVRNNGYVHTFTPDKTVNYENLVKLEYQQQGGKYLGEEAVQMRITAYFGIPKSASRKRREKMAKGEILPTGKRDLDNIAKSIADALNGVAYKDDAQITVLEVRKYYAEEPRVDVEIEKYMT